MLGPRSGPTSAGLGVNCLQEAAATWAFQVWSCGWPFRTCPHHPRGPPPCAASCGPRDVARLRPRLLSHVGSRGSGTGQFGAEAQSGSRQDAAGSEPPCVTPTPPRGARGAASGSLTPLPTLLSLLSPCRRGKVLGLQTAARAGKARVCSCSAVPAQHALSCPSLLTCAQTLLPGPSRPQLL